MQSTCLRRSTSAGTSAANVLIYRRNGKVHVLQLPRWHIALAAGTGVVLFSMALGTGFHLIGRTLATDAAGQRAGMQSHHTDQIAALQAEIEYASRRRLAAENTLNGQVIRLQKRQQEIAVRHQVVARLIDRAGTAGIRLAGTPLPEGWRSSHIPWKTAPPQKEAQPPILDRLEMELRRTFTEQIAALDSVAHSAETDLVEIDATARQLGVELRLTSNGPAENQPLDHTGGPFTPLSRPLSQWAPFDEAVERTKMAMARLETAKQRARGLPLSLPLRGVTRLTSRFGPRLDPFLRRPAMHNGLDFRAVGGRAVRATAAGRVVSARRNGGYGRMVVLDHGNSLSTRYAHLHRFNVKTGDRVEKGEIIGLVGSSGRSTGDHLHYETRIAGKPVNPLPFILAGRRLRHLLDTHTDLPTTSR